MPMATAAMLRDRAVLSVEGAGARDFLQGLITNDINRCRDGEALYSALLTPQGKILFDFLVVARESAFLLDCAGSSAEQLSKRLSFYRLRAKVSISRRPELAIAALWGAPPPAISGMVAFADPRLPALGTRMLGETSLVETAVAQSAPGDYDAFRLSLGVPDSRDIPPDQVFALDAGMEELNGVSFTKGCFVGQEVTARMKHRSTARRRFYIIESAEPLSPGTALEAQGREVGRVTSGQGCVGLALVRLDRIAETLAAGAQIQAGGHPIHLTRPDWLHE